jgi:hypothetical protein
MTREPMLQFTTNEVPIVIAYMHNMISSGNARTYRETPSRVFACIIPTEGEKLSFGYLDGVEELWLVYKRREG